MRQYTFKGDHRFSNANSVFGRYSFFNHKTDNGAGGATVYPNEVVSKRDDDLKNWNVVVSDTHVFSPTVVNEFRVGVTRGYFPFVVRSFGGDWPAKLGLPSIVPPDTVPSISNGLPAFNTGTAGLRGSLNWQFLDQVNIIRGAHSFKAGFDLRLLQGHNLHRGRPAVVRRASNCSIPALIEDGPRGVGVQLGHEPLKGNRGVADVLHASRSSRMAGTPMSRVPCSW
jgi:hypothetical protein